MSATMLAPDPAVPSRDVMLDGAAMAPRLARCIGRPVERCEPLRARYQVGRSLRVLYGVTSDGTRQLVSSRTFEGTRSAEVYRGTAHRGAVHDEQLGAVFFAFPNDRKLRGLHALAGERVIAYAPEKCATARARGGFAKVYAGDEGARTRQFHDALQPAAANAGLRLPRALAYDESTRTLVCEAIPGRPLSTLRDGDRATALAHFGAALAKLHRLPEPPGVPRFARTSSAALGEAAQVVAQARPDCAAAVRCAVERLIDNAPPDGEAVCLHGDVHLKNAIVSGDEVALIDLDQVATGPAAADVGSFIAALRCARITSACSAREERAQVDAFVSGYGPGLDERALNWHIAAALVAERALRAVTRVRRDALLHLPAIIAEAQR